MTITRIFVILVYVSRIVFASDAGEEILGCGGYVKSPYKLDFDKIEIKLFTKQGSLKMKTECAPTTGYYFIPLDGKGDYILKVSPPEGWKFDPPEYPIKFDGKTDKCSRGVDINFDFKGFSIFGKVVTSGFAEGPSGIALQLLGPGNLKVDTVTTKGGSFSFGSIPPGSYKLIATHKTLIFEKDSFSFDINNKNVVVENQIAISGYEVAGKVSSDTNPVEGVILLLISQSAETKAPKHCTAVKQEDVHLSANIKGNVICQTSSDSTGIYRFKGLKPGTYIIVPVYKGKNIVYNVSPDRLDFELQHNSVELPQPFEVEGFTVQGKVKNLPVGSQTQIFVNGALKATTTDGNFAIAKMKPGNYKFKIKAEKFQFDEIPVSITALNPMLPDFSPSRFLTCGKVEISSSIPKPLLNLVLQNSIGTDKKVFREQLTDPHNSCAFLPEGNYKAWLESSPEKYFLPSQIQIKVPSESTFEFKEFTGSIGGKISCPYSSCDGLKLIVENRNVGTIVQDRTIGHDETAFKFENLGSGDYRVRIIDEKFCWNKDSFNNIQLKDASIDNVNFVQTGYTLEIISTHKTDVRISGNGKASVQNFELNADSPKRLCLTDTNSKPSSYKIEPIGCHQFEKLFYPYDVGTVIELVAIKHEFTGVIYSPAKITDLKLTKNGVAYNLHQLLKKDNEVQVMEKSTTDGRFQYEITYSEEPGSEIQWQIFSYGFLFEPNSFSIQAKDDCQRDVFRVVAKKSHVIKGKLLPPLEGVEIRIDLVGDPDATTYVSSNADGEYIAGPFVHPSGFKITPEMSGYTFKELANDPYSFTVHQLAKIQIKVESGAEPLASVLLSLSGPNTYRQNKVTDANGEMTFGDLQPGQYYLKALLKEFQFQPSATHIDLKEQETKQFTLRARRESFSLYGQLSSLGGELVPNLLVSARGLGNCSEYGEEGTSDDNGNFRIWALKSFCNYQISVVKKDEFAQKVERTIPTNLDVVMGTGDLWNVSFLVIPPVKRLDLSLRCYTNNVKSLETLKAVVYSTRSPDTPLHTSPFNGVSYIVLPPIPKDDSDYFITFESNLNRFQYNYKLPPDINFTANVAYAHFKIYFDIEPASIDPEIGKNSYIAFAMVVLVILLIANFEKIGLWVKNAMENYSNNSATVQVSKKSKVKTK